MLFQFVCPSRETRSHTFRLCNLPVAWEAESSALVMTDGKRRRFDLWSLVDGRTAQPEVFRHIMANVRSERGGSMTNQETYDRLIAEVLSPPARPRPQPESEPYDL